MSVGRIGQDGEGGALHRASERAGAVDGTVGWAEQVGRIAFVAAIAFVAFLAGAFVAFAKIYPYPLLNAAYRAGDALYSQAVNFADPLQTDLWATARTPARGVTTHDPARASPGYTLYTSGHHPTALLIDMDGRVVYRWHRPFSELWDETSAVRRPRPDRFVHIDKAVLFPNGDLLATYMGLGDTPWGLGLVKLDRDSRVLWKFLERTHHDVRVAADGRIYTLTHETRHRPVPGAAELEPPLIEDFLVVLSSDGEVERRVSLLEALARSPFQRILHTVPAFARQDPLHANAVEPIEGEAATRFPHARPGDVLVSLRELNLVVAVDPERGEVVWGTNGPWIAQHAPVLLESGRLLLFDNMGNVGRGGASRVIEVDPGTMEVVWSYGGPGQPLDSPRRSSQQRLANGNTLITESDAGRLLEVTPSGEIVWEYVNPVRGGAGDAKVPIVSWAQRYAPEQLDPSFPSRDRLADRSE